MGVIKQHGKRREYVRFALLCWRMVVLGYGRLNRQVGGKS